MPRLCSGTGRGNRLRLRLEDRCRFDCVDLRGLGDGGSGCCVSGCVGLRLAPPIPKVATCVHRFVMRVISLPPPFPVSLHQAFLAFASVAWVAFRSISARGSSFWRAPVWGWRGSAAPRWWWRQTRVFRRGPRTRRCGQVDE